MACGGRPGLALCRKAGNSPKVTPAESQSWALEPSRRPGSVLLTLLPLLGAYTERWGHSWSSGALREMPVGTQSATMFPGYDLEKFTKGLKCACDPV